MIKHYKKLLSALMLLVAASSLYAQHDAGDKAALQSMIVNNFTVSTALNWGTEPNPDLWDGVTWDASSPKRVIVLSLANNFTNTNGAGVLPALSGNIDISALTLLQEAHFGQNDNVTSIDASGLANLEVMGASNMDNLTSLDVSNCTSLLQLYVKGNANMTSLNVTGALSLEGQLKLRNSKLTSLNLVGVTALTNIGLRNSESLTSLSVTGITDLQRIKITESKISVLDVTGCTNLSTLKAARCKLTDIVGSETLPITSYRVRFNKLPYTKTTQLYGIFSPINDNFDDQVLIPGATVASGGTVDYSSLASIVVLGSPATTTFNLYDASNTLVSTNTTGLFSGLADGSYYLNLNNSGYSRNTLPIIVGTLVPDPAYSNADYLILMGFKANNISSPTLNWGSVTDLSQMNGVTWDASSPRRVTQLRLSEESKNNSAGTELILSGTMDFTGLTMLERLYLVGQTGLTNINVSGLISLQYLYTSRSGITALDASDLASLYEVRASGDIINTVDVSNTPILDKLKLKMATNLTSYNISSSGLNDLALKGSPATTLDFSGNTTLENIGLGESAIVNLNVSNCTSLQGVSTRRSLNLASINVSGSANLTRIVLSRGNLTSLDVTGLTNLATLRVGKNDLTDVTGALALTSLTTFKAKENKMPLNVAAPLRNMPSSVGNSNFVNQRVYPDVVVDLNDNVDYSNQASIVVNGTPVATTFDLYDNTNVFISSNSTGIFTMSTLGDFYVTMSNSGVTVRTGTISVVDIATQPVISASLDNSDFGTTSVGTSVARTLTITNIGGVTLTVSSIILPAGFTLTGSVTTIAPSASATLTVTFTPTTIMTYNGNIYIASDAAAGNGQITVTGIGSPVSGVYAKKESFLSFYPNPTSDKMLVKQTNMNLAMLYIYSMEGILVKEVDLGQSSVVDVQALPKGVYVVKSEDGTITERFVKL